MAQPAHATDDPVNTRLNALCIIVPACLTCLLVLDCPPLHLPNRTVGLIIVVLIPAIVLPFLMSYIATGVVSRSRSIKTTAYSLQFGFLLGMSVALAWSTFIWHQDHPEAFYIVTFLTLLRGASLGMACLGKW